LSTIAAMPLRYPLSSYDDYLSLKPPFLLWLVMLYLCRAVTLPLLMGLAAFAGINADTRSLFAGYFSIQAVIPSLIAAPVLFALLRRSPSAPMAVRWIWAHGRILLAVSAGLGLLLTLLDSPLRHGELNEQMGLPLLLAAIDLFCVVYVLAARYVRDVFADFPAPVADTKPS
jgi:Protein of unknown function (DUF2919)